MFLGGGLITAYASPVAVQLPAVDTSNTLGPPSSIVYAGLRFDSDGGIYRMTSGGTWSYAAAWLNSGSASSYYLFRTVTSGTLTNDDGDGNQLNTDNLDYWISNSVDWYTRITNVTFNICDDTAGSNVLATRSYSIRAILEGSGSPP